MPGYLGRESTDGRFCSVILSLCHPFFQSNKLKKKIQAIIGTWGFGKTAILFIYYEFSTMCYFIYTKTENLAKAINISGEKEKAD